MNKKGFTIIELIVVIAIIAVLAAIVAVNVVGYINKSKDASVVANMKTMMTNAAVWYDTSTNTQNGNAFIGSANAQAAITAITASDNNTGAVKAYGGASTVQDWCVETTIYASSAIECADNTGFIGTISATHCSSSVFTCK